MHARELAELAALVAVHGPILVRSSEQIPQDSIEEYWIASKGRLDSWARTLRTLGKAAGGDSASGTCRQPLDQAVLEEVLVSEVLTRVWAGVVCVCDRQQQTDVAEPAARSVLIGHLEARNRVLTLLARSPGIDAEYAVKLNRLRRRSERWADMLVGMLLEYGDVADLAVEPDRAREFAQDLRCQAQQAGGRHARSLVLASLRAAFRQGLAPESPNGDLNGRIAESVLSCFPPDVFESTGVFRSAWLARLTSFTDETQGAIEELIGASSSTGPCGDGLGVNSRRLANRLRRFGRRP